MAMVTGDTPTPIDLINLTIALFALAAALGSLGWQIAAHFLTAGRVKLEPFNGLAHESGRDMLTLPTPNAMPTKTIETFRGEGYTKRVDHRAVHTDVVMTAAGVDTSCCCCPYVAGWANGDLDVFAKTAERVVLVARRIVDRGRSGQ